MSRYLIVATHARLRSSLLDLIRTKAADGRSSFHVVVPATPPKEGSTWTDEQAHALAAERLVSALTSLRNIGVQVDGEVGDASPLLAVADALRRSSFDGILLSTLPGRLARWLQIDLPSRMQASFAIPVFHAGSYAAPDLVA
jgi:hypothetical protein